MRLHDRLVLRSLLRAICFTALAFVVIFVVADLNEKMDDFLDADATLHTILMYYVYGLADIVRLTLPVDLLLATMFTLGIMGRNNELVALLSSGVSLLRICRPILVVGGLAVGASWLIAEEIAPRTNARRLRIERVDIEKRPALDAPLRTDFTFRGKNGNLVYARILNVEKERMTGVAVHRYRDGRLVARLDAESAEWRDGVWEFHDGTYRDFEPRSGADSLVFFAAEPPYRMPDLVESPLELAQVPPQPEAMAFGALRDHVRRVRAGGGRVNDFLVDLYTKVSAPWTNLILVLLGIGLSASKRKTSLAAGFGITGVTAFLFLAVQQIAAALGKNEVLPPVLAAWIAPALFAIASTFLLARVNR